MNSNGMAIEIPFSRGAQLDSRVDGGLVCPSNAAYLEPDRRVGESIYFRSFILYYLGGDDIVPFPCYQPNGVFNHSFNGGCDGDAWLHRRLLPKGL